MDTDKKKNPSGVKKGKPESNIVSKLFFENRLISDSYYSNPRIIFSRVLLGERIISKLRPLSAVYQKLRLRYFGSVGKSDRGGNRLLYNFGVSPTRMPKTDVKVDTFWEGKPQFFYSKTVSWNKINFLKYVTLLEAKGNTEKDVNSFCSPNAACGDSQRRPSRFLLSIGNKKQSQSARSGLETKGNIGKDINSFCSPNAACRDLQQQPLRFLLEIHNGGPRGFSYL